MTMARILLSHADALVGYKYCNGVNNRDPEEDIWIAQRWMDDLNVEDCLKLTHRFHRNLTHPVFV